MPILSQILDHMFLQTLSKSHQQNLPLMESRKITINRISDELLQLFTCLPDEIIIEILLRVPVKSLLKFRCVSKSWLLLLSSHHFIETQIKFSIKECKNVDFIRLVIVSSVSGLGKMCSIYSIACGNDGLNVDRLDYTLSAPPASARFVGSCNGLICLTAASFKLMLWNPSTGKYKEFQDSFVQSGGDYFVRCGFGYDAATEDYKVVKIFSYPKNEGKHENMVKIYSARANSWTMIQSFNSGYINGQGGVFVNGALHWDIRPCGNSNAEIITLCLVTETLGVMALPSCGNGDISWTLSALDGRLVACCKCNYYPDRTDVWVMKEYGVVNSWTKLVSLTSPVDRRGYMTPLFMSENGVEVLVKLGTEISLYNSRNASYKRMEFHESSRCLQVQSATYIESLTSPDVR